MKKALTALNAQSRKAVFIYDNKRRSTHSNWNYIMSFISRVRNRRFVAVDKEQGIVFAVGFIDHDSLNWT